MRRRVLKLRPGPKLGLQANEASPRGCAATRDARLEQHARCDPFLGREDTTVDRA